MIVFVVRRNTTPPKLALLTPRPFHKYYAMNSIISSFKPEHTTYSFPLMVNKSEAAKKILYSQRMSFLTIVANALGESPYHFSVTTQTPVYLHLYPARAFPSSQ